MLSDGDSSTYAHLCALKVYGDDVVIHKEECVNHIVKQMGTGLCNLAEMTKKAGVSPGGHCLNAVCTEMLQCR